MTDPSYDWSKCRYGDCVSIWDCSGGDCNGNNEGGHACPGYLITSEETFTQECDGCDGLDGDAPGPSQPECRLPETGRRSQWITTNAPSGANVTFDTLEVCDKSSNHWIHVVKRALALLVQDKDIVDYLLCNNADANACLDTVDGLLSGQPFNVSIQRPPVMPATRLAPAQTYCANSHADRPNTIQVYLAYEVGCHTDLFAADTGAGVTAALIDLAGDLLHEMLHLCNADWDEDAVNVNLPPDRPGKAFAAAAKAAHGL